MTMKWIATPNGVVNLEATSCVYIEPIDEKTDYWACRADGHALKLGTRQECSTFIDDLMSNVDVLAAYLRGPIDHGNGITMQRATMTRVADDATESAK